MKPYEINDCNIYGTVSRQLEEVADSLDKNILREAAEDRALILQADDSENGALLCEKYRMLIAGISKTKEDLAACVDRLNSMNRTEN